MEDPSLAKTKELNTFDIPGKGVANSENCIANSYSREECSIRQKSPLEQTPRILLKNVLVIGFVFLLLFTAYNGVANLQSSINAEEGLGNNALAAIYAAFIFSSLLLPSFLIEKLTLKWTLASCILGYAIFIAAQFHPTFWTLIPAAVILGLCAAPLWVSKATYITHAGREYATLVGESSENVMVRFFGIFFLTFQSSQIWGNLISSTLLSYGDSSVSSIERNITVCGASFCPSDAQSGEVITRPSQSKINTLIGVYVGSALLACVITMVFLDRLVSFEEKGAAANPSLFHLLSATFRQMVKPNQILLIPLTFWAGLEQAFFCTDFTQAYISCSWGVENVGYVLICFGVATATASIAFAPVIRYIGRIPVFIFAGILNVSLIIGLFLWKPDPTSGIIYFIIAAFWGIGDGIWQAQIKALYAMVFENNEEAAYSNHGLWEPLGFLTGYIISNKACINTKLFVMLGIIAAGMLGYVSVEVSIRKSKKLPAESIRL